MKFQVSKIPHIDAAKHLAGLINKSLADAQNKVLLSLAGGSAVDVYNEADALLDDTLNFSNLFVVMGDERWNIDPMHKDSDWLHFTQTSLYNFFATHNAKLINTLHGTNHKSEAAELDQLFKIALTEGFETIAMLGIGADGHTAGILPAERELFEKTFRNNAHAVAHELDTVYPQRITITPYTISNIDHVFAYAKGEAKKHTLQLIADLDKSFPDNKWQDNLHKYPALFLSTADATIFTDQLIRQ